MSNAKLVVDPYYIKDFQNLKRRKTVQVDIGGIYCGSDYPIRVQSMTTVDTMDTEGSIEQVIRMVDAGCEYVRITAPSLKEAENLQNIRDGLRTRGYQVPLVADIHFTPNAAEKAAYIVEKVRINPGNYADKKKFEQLDYTDASYQSELDRIYDRFKPLVDICNQEGKAMRIGTNHGSLSDRIMSRYGDSPEGMVESALEFIRICEAESFYNLVVSMKSSNPQVMVYAYRLLVKRLEEEQLKPYPLHLGVTEAGEGEDGRIKSALGIGTLLEDGLGDTVRVSLTEAPEAEAPVAKKLIDRYEASGIEVPNGEAPVTNPYTYTKRSSREVLTIGGANVPRVLADFSHKKFIEIKDLKAIGHHYLPELDKWGMSDHGADFVYTGGTIIDFMLPNGLKQLVDSDLFVNDKRDDVFPLWTLDDFSKPIVKHPEINFVSIPPTATDHELKSLDEDKTVVLLVKDHSKRSFPVFRSLGWRLQNLGLELPIIWAKRFSIKEEETFQLHASTDLGGPFIDGLGDGVLVTNSAENTEKIGNSIAFGLLQAARQRMTKTEYISCPSCGRTLFDLQETTAMIRKRTDHLKGIKIGIMGCIVNGPGEMADADYGYVGSGKGKITLYKGQEVMKRGVPSAMAVDELIKIIDEDGNWTEPSTELSNLTK